MACEFVRRNGWFGISVALEPHSLTPPNPQASIPLRLLKPREHLATLDMELHGIHDIKIFVCVYQRMTSITMHLHSS